MANDASERDALVNRMLPEMKLSDGSSSSMTPPPGPFPADLDAEGRARFRFAVEGNAVRKQDQHSVDQSRPSSSCARWN